ncbi:carbohydrate ABC transporter permease [Lachnoclostridium phytofermentans]|uniref:carbohydrate ABC transporter permease n=1 Tax=Lachnoclostridium phytofermentans TaxID=66219 RepID=UPI0004952446|nr:carbohydrate ABC transporter permease [Lachnoclostridium phytofermentans]
MYIVKQKRNRRISGDKIFGFINLFLLLLFVLIILYPIYYMFIVSISGSANVVRGEVKWFPINVNWNSYKTILNNESLGRSYFNTVFYTVAGTSICLFMSALCAYPLSRKNLFGKKFLTFFIVFTMLFDVGMIPKFLVVDALHLRNTVFSILLPSAINVYYMIMIRTFFQNVPEEMLESAKMDGASELRIFFKIMLPLSKPVLASVTLFYAVGIWNSYLSPLLYLDEKKLYPLQLILRNIVISNEMSSMSGDIAAMNISTMNIKYAVIFVSILPILCVYPFIQKYFNKGVMVGAVKG